MYWKKYKNLSKQEKNDESHFILGIDLGNNSSIISFFDKNRLSPEIIDVSGGYGKPSIPTVMQYMTETKEWIFGEYAVLNKGVGKDITLDSLMSRLGKKEYVEIEAKSITIAHVLSLYLKELIGNVKNINPKGEIVGIVVSIPSYLSEEAKEELLLSFKIAGYDKELIDLVEDRECIFTHYYYGKQIESEKVMLLDFGSRELRGGIYEVTPLEGYTLIKSLSSLFDVGMGTDRINNIVTELFTEYYCRQFDLTRNKLTSQMKIQLHSFVYQHKDLLFQKNIAVKPARLYFNFAYPPFQQTVTKENIDDAISSFIEDFESFIHKVLEKNIYDCAKKITINEINTVLCTGGGFEMLWAREVVEQAFQNSKIMFYKNSKGIISEGAAISAASKVNVIDEKKFVVEDLNQLNIDVGIKIQSEKKERFLPIIERNSFWWQSHNPRMLLLKDKTDKSVDIQLFKRNINGDIEHLQSIVLEGLPSRPRGTTKLMVQLKFENYNELIATVSDMGFGELFPKTDYKEEFSMMIHE